jgi:hypothetical protein
VGSHPCRQEGAAIVLAELDQLGIELWVVPIGRLDGALGVVKEDSPRYAAERPKCILQGADKALGILLEEDFGVALS